MHGFDRHAHEYAYVNFKTRSVAEFPLLDKKRFTKVHASIGGWNCFAYTYRGEIAHFRFKVDTSAKDFS